ncbi:MAG TPA: sigma-70 family RNA polymerase sigma factor [Planctomycetota bacterium]
MAFSLTHRARPAAADLRRARGQTAGRREPKPPLPESVAAIFPARRTFDFTRPAVSLPMVSDTTRLLDRHHAGDPTALSQLLVLHLPAIRDLVHRRLPKVLRRDDDTMDIVQDVAIQVLKEGPKFRCTDETQFRTLVGVMVANRLCDRLRAKSSQKRTPAMEVGSLNDSVANLAQPTDQQLGPATGAGRHEMEAMIRLALEILPADVRQLIQWHDYDRHSHKEIGARLGITPAAAHMRCSTAHERLAEVIIKLRSGAIEELEQGSAPE